MRQAEHGAQVVEPAHGHMALLRLNPRPPRDGAGQRQGCRHLDAAVEVVRQPAPPLRGAHALVPVVPQVDAVAALVGGTERSE
eukprot:6256090-Alexandrium_andersonii.AAC.1